MQQFVYTVEDGLALKPAGILDGTAVLHGIGYGRSSCPCKGRLFDVGYMAERFLFEVC